MIGYVKKGFYYLQLAETVTLILADYRLRVYNVYFPASQLQKCNIPGHEATNSYENITLSQESKEHTQKYKKLKIYNIPTLAAYRTQTLFSSTTSQILRSWTPREFIKQWDKGPRSKVLFLTRKGYYMQVYKLLKEGVHQNKYDASLELTLGYKKKWTCHHFLFIILPVILYSCFFWNLKTAEKNIKIHQEDNFFFCMVVR